MRKYAIVAGDFVKTGGMDRANYALASYLARQGQRVTLIGYRADSDLLASGDVELRAVPKPMNSYTLSGPLLASSALAHFARHRDVEFVVNGGNCSLPGTNWVHYVHAAFAPRLSLGRARAAFAQAKHLTAQVTERTALRLAKRVIANSNRTREDLIERVGVPEDRVRVIYLGIDPTQFRTASDDERTAARQELGWDLESPHIAFIGAMQDRRKGFDVLFDAWRLLCRGSSWDARLVVIGAGTELPAWQERARREGVGEQILFLGFRKDVPRVLSACDAFVAPTRYEPYGVAVQEALCSGIPAIVSRASGVAERYPTSLESLLLDDPESATELASRLRAWRGNLEALRTLVRREVTETLRQRTWDDMSREIVEFMGEDSL